MVYGEKVCNILHIRVVQSFGVRPLFNANMAAAN